jgi:quinoprotein glucose dehydrogenase
MFKSRLFLSILVAAGMSACHNVSDAPPVVQTDNHDWRVYLGDKASSQYSSLTQINKNNVNDLEIAWTYSTGDVWSPRFSQIQTNALVINGVLYGLSPRLNLFALNAQTGEELWRFDPASVGTAVADGSDTQAMGTSRGLSYWESGDDKRLFVGIGSKLHAINVTTGELVTSFGNGGYVDIREGLDRDLSQTFIAITTPGVVYKDLLIQGMRVGEGPQSAPGHVRAYDVKTGALVWTFHTIPRPGEFGYETWPSDAWEKIGGANNWAGMSLDETRGIVFVPTGSAAFDFWGGDRVGENLFSNSLIALDAATGKRLWHFQTVHHDIWDRDLPAPPNVVTVKHDGKTIDAVAQITKSGFVFLFDRVTGKPLFPIEERAVPASTLNGEQAWPTQPFPTKPEPYARQILNKENIRKDDPTLLARLKELRSEGQFSPFSTEGSILFPGYDGGGEWGGAAASPDGILYINSNEMPWIAKMNEVQAHVKATSGAEVYQQNCAACHGEDRLGGPQKSYPALDSLASRLSREQVKTVVHQGRNFMPAFPNLTEQEMNGLLSYLWNDPDVDFIADETSPAKESLMQDNSVPYTFDGYHRFVDSDGNAAVEPPWGTLNALDLNTGEYLWRVPLGDMKDSALAGETPTGAENYGGPVVTAGGLIFIAATKDEMFRAFDKDTGELLWQTKLPFGGYATPSIYSVDGVQYVVIAAGGGKMGTPSGDSYIAFRLKKQ